MRATGAFPLPTDHVTVPASMQSLGKGMYFDACVFELLQMNAEL